MPLQESPSVRKARFISTIADLRALTSRMPADRREGAALFLDALASVLSGSGPAPEHFVYLIAGEELHLENLSRVAADQAA